MSENILQLCKPEPNADVVRHLRELLAEAETGRVSALMTFSVVQDQLCSRRTGEWRDMTKIVGGMEMAKLDFYALMRSK